MDSFLKRALKGQAYSKLPLVEEGSDRRYTRIILKNPKSKKSKQPYQLKSSGFFSEQTQDQSWILSCSPLTQKKYFLWRQADFLKAGLNVPALHPSHKTLSSAASQGFLLIEDLGDRSLETQVMESQSFPHKYYIKALDQLIKLQKGAHTCLKGGKISSSKKETDLSQNFLFQHGKKLLPWTKKDFLREMLYTEKYLIQKFLNYRWDKGIRAVVLEEWGALCKKLAGFTFLPGHRDFHSRNLFVKNNKIFMIDFQDAGFFPRFYDAVSLIYDAYVDSKVTHRDRRRLLAYFISKCGFSESRKALTEETALTAVQRLFQAVGRFAGFYCLKKQKTHLKYIYPALKLQKDLLKKHKKTYPAFSSLTKDLLNQLKNSHPL